MKKPVDFYTSMQEIKELTLSDGKGESKVIITGMTHTPKTGEWTLEIEVVSTPSEINSK